MRAHTRFFLPLVTVLDRDGRPLLTQEGLGRDRGPVLDALAGLRP